MFIRPFLRCFDVLGDQACYAAAVVGTSRSYRLAATSEVHPPPSSKVIPLVSKFIVVKIEAKYIEQRIYNPLIWKFVKTRPNASECIQMHPTKCECIRMSPNMSKNMQNSTVAKTLKNFENLSYKNFFDGEVALSVLQ